MTWHGLCLVVVLTFLLVEVSAQEDAETLCALATSCEACARLAANGTECGYLVGSTASSGALSACVPGNSTGPFNATYAGGVMIGNISSFEAGFCCAGSTCADCITHMGVCGYSFTSHGCGRRTPGDSLESTCRAAPLANVEYNDCLPYYPALFFANLTQGELAAVSVEIVALVGEMTIGDQGPQRQYVNASAIDDQKEAYQNSPADTNLTACFPSAIAENRESRALNVTITCLAPVCSVDLRLYCSVPSYSFFNYILYAALILCAVGGCGIFIGGLRRRRTAAARAQGAPAPDIPAPLTRIHIAILPPAPRAQSRTGAARKDGAATPYQPRVGEAVVVVAPGYEAILRRAERGSGKGKKGSKSSAKKKRRAEDSSDDAGSHADSDTVTSPLIALDLSLGVRVGDERDAPAATSNRAANTRTRGAKAAAAATTI